MADVADVVPTPILMTSCCCRFRTNKQPNKQPNRPSTSFTQSTTRQAVSSFQLKKIRRITTAYGTSCNRVLDTCNVIPSMVAGASANHPHLDYVDVDPQHHLAFFLVDVSSLPFLFRSLTATLVLPAGPSMSGMKCTSNVTTFHSPCARQVWT